MKKWNELNRRPINPLSAKHIWWNLLILDLVASVDIRPLPGAWVAELLGVQVHKKYQISNGHWQLRG